MRSMGLDFGDKTIGIAISDPLGWTAQAKGNQEKNLTDDFAQLKNTLINTIFREIIVGLPVNMDGTAGSRVKKTEEFVNFLRRGLRYRLRSGMNVSVHGRQKTYSWRQI